MICLSIKDADSSNPMLSLLRHSLDGSTKEERDASPNKPNTSTDFTTNNPIGHIIWSCAWRLLTGSLLFCEVDHGKLHKHKSLPTYFIEARPLFGDYLRHGYYRLGRWWAMVPCPHRNSQLATTGHLCSELPPSGVAPGEGDESWELLLSSKGLFKPPD